MIKNTIPPEIINTATTTQTTIIHVFGDELSFFILTSFEESVKPLEALFCVSFPLSSFDVELSCEAPFCVLLFLELLIVVSFRLLVLDC